MITLSIRLDFPDGSRLGPGKVALLKAIAKEGSIAGAARILGMSYPRAFKLIDDLNDQFAEPLVEKTQGGPKGGGAHVTTMGQQVIVLIEELYEATSQATISARQRLEAYV